MNLRASFVLVLACVFAIPMPWGIPSALAVVGVTVAVARMAPPNPVGGETARE